MIIVELLVGIRCMVSLYRLSLLMIEVCQDTVIISIYTELSSMHNLSLSLPLLFFLPLFMQYKGSWIMMVYCLVGVIY